jgi:hypothetical protein
MVAAAFIVILLLAIAFDMPAMLAAVLVAGIVAGCVEYYARAARTKKVEGGPSSPTLPDD